MTVRRAIRGSNRMIGIIMLIMLLVLIGPNTLPRLLNRLFRSETFQADEGVGCANLRTATDRALHQSLIGRETETPLELSVQVDRTGVNLLIRVTITNKSIGTVPILYNVDEILIGQDNQTTGLGILFEPAISVTSNATRAQAASYDENDIRLLGPRQRCVHREQIAISQFGPNLSTAGVEVIAYYGVTSPGQILSDGTNATPIFSDQGLHVQNNRIVSPGVEIPAINQAN